MDSPLSVPSVGLVLGGGGARGFFHVGVIKALRELHVPVTEIAGTSIGAVVGAMYAADPDRDIEALAKEVDFGELIRLMIWGNYQPKPGEIKNYMHRFIGVERFEALKLKLKFNATDMNHRQEVVFDRGDLYPPLLGAIAVPGLIRPIHYQGRYLMDGGLMNNLPVALVESASTLIVSDITGPIKPVDENSLGPDVLYSAVALMQQQHGLSEMKTLKNHRIIHLNLEDHDVSILDFRRQNFQRLIDQGYAAVMAQRAEIISGTRKSPAPFSLRHLIGKSGLMAALGRNAR